ncbi:MAG: gluconokinase [Alphaproteobacteria bacterium]|nr:gluconokinase [Alphaproteobacteria bacterium]
MTVPTQVIVVMGVSGVGKTTVGRRLADALGWGYAEGDTYHPTGNVEKMRAGTPLDDRDRWPWLDAMAADIDRWLVEGRPHVLTCSALKRIYRERLIGDRRGVRLVALEGAEAVIRNRLERRVDHYMPPTLLASQLATLEPPAMDERPITINVDAEPERCVAVIRAALDGELV